MSVKSPSFETLRSEAQKLCVIMNEAPDFVCVLIGTSYLDQILANLLERYFIEDSSTSRNILSSTGVLGTFNSRSDLSYCLGLIPKGLYQNLLVIGEIRNILAHNHLELNLSDKMIAEKIKKLTYPDVNKGSTSDGPRIFSSTNSLRNKFNYIVILMVDRLLIIGLSIKNKEKETETEGW